MITSRTLVAVPAALLALTVSACGSGADDAPVPSAANARTAACRGYLLNVGDSDREAIKTLRDGAGYADPDATKDAFAPLRDAAATSGLVAGLSDADFALFKKVVDEIDDLEDAISVDDEGTGTLAPSTVDAVDDALLAVQKRCS